MRVLLWITLFIAIAAARPTSAQAPDVLEQQTALSVTIDGRAEQLETLIVRPAAEGRYPLALIVNGSSPNPGDAQAAWIAHLAHDFAHRGWLAASVLWRGYGTSTGTLQDEAGTCTEPNVAKFLDAHAADLAAALASLHRRPDVEPATTIGLGISIGGASMLDLAAQAGHPLGAVINISGGLYHDAKPFAPNPTCGLFEDDLVREVGSFGRAAVPTLWIYASNDPLFQPRLVKRMAAAYREGGGTADLEMLPPFELGGHMLFRWEANPLTQPLIDRFLRANGLPATDGAQAFAPILARLAPDDGQLLEYYLRLPTEKALAAPTDGSGGLYFASTLRSMEDARQQAAQRCRAISRVACEIVAENTALAGTWRERPSHVGGQ